MCLYLLITKNIISDRLAYFFCRRSFHKINQFGGRYFNKMSRRNDLRFLRQYGGQYALGVSLNISKYSFCVS